MENKFTDLTHQFHGAYRASGIALCISLATAASAEGYWFYKLLKDIELSTFQEKLCLLVIITALLLFAFSFCVQFLHYYGMKHMAKSFYAAYKEENESSKKKLKKWKKEKEKEWEEALCFFKKANKAVCLVMITTICNFIFAIFYLKLYRP